MILCLGRLVIIRPFTGGVEPPELVIPDNVLLDEQDQPILDEQGNFIIVTL